MSKLIIMCIYFYAHIIYLFHYSAHRNTPKALSNHLCKVCVLYISAIFVSPRENVLDGVQDRAKNTQTLDDWPRTLSTVAILCPCGVTCTKPLLTVTTDSHDSARIRQALKRSARRHTHTPHVCHVTWTSSPQIVQILQLEDLEPARIWSNFVFSCVWM